MTRRFWPGGNTPISRGNAFDLTAPRLVDWRDLHRESASKQREQTKKTEQTLSDKAPMFLAAIGKEGAR